MTRAALDLYPTDPAVCDAVLQQLDVWGLLPDGSAIIEPHVGLWRWVEALDRFAARTGRRLSVTAHDIDPAHLKARTAADFPHLRSVAKLPPGDWLVTAARLRDEGTSYSLGIGNPPFSVCDEGATRGQVVAHHHVDATRSVCTSTAMLVRSQLWSASKDPERLRWANDAPLYRIELAPRPGFTDDGRLGQFASTVGVWSQRKRPGGESTAKMLIWKPELLAQETLFGGAE